MSVTDAIRQRSVTRRLFLDMTVDRREQSAQHNVDILHASPPRLCSGVLFAARFSRAICVFERVGIDGVDLRQDDDLRLFGEAAIIGLQFVADRLIGLARMFAAGVDEMQKHAAALDMAEEMIAEAEAFMRALDQPRNIGEHEFAAVAGDDAELRMQRREGIIGDLRLGGGDRGEEGRFAGIGQTDEAGVGDQFQDADAACALHSAGRDWRGAAPDWSPS